MPPDVLVFRAATRRMNPTVRQEIIDRALEADPAAAAAEYLAQFRDDIEGFVRPEVVDAAIVSGCYELPPVPDRTYHGFYDGSGQIRDSTTLGIAHAADGVAVLDLLREAVPPCSPEHTIKDFAATLKMYGIYEVVGDRYAGEWPREQFRKYGIAYRPSDLVRSDLYRELLPMLNSGTVQLLDHPRLRAQLLGLERRTGRAGKDTIDHGPHGHDDVINAAAGALTLAARLAAVPKLALLNGGDTTLSVQEQAEMEEELRQARLAESAGEIEEALASRRFWFPNDPECW